MITLGIEGKSYSFSIEEAEILHDYLGKALSQEYLNLRQCQACKKHLTYDQFDPTNVWAFCNACEESFKIKPHDCLRCGETITDAIGDACSLDCYNIMYPNAGSIKGDPFNRQTFFGEYRGYNKGLDMNIESKQHLESVMKEKNLSYADDYKGHKFEKTEARKKNLAARGITRKEGR